MVRMTSSATIKNFFADSLLKVDSAHTFCPSFDALLATPNPSLEPSASCLPLVTSNKPSWQAWLSYAFALLSLPFATSFSHGRWVCWGPFYRGTSASSAVPQSPALYARMVIRLFHHAVTALSSCDSPGVRADGG